MAEPIGQNPLALPFHADLMALYEEARRKCKLPAPAFLQMVKDYGAVGAARRLLDDPKIQSGFTDLILCGCKDLSVEVLVLRPEYQCLFTEEQLARARERIHGDQHD